MKEIPVYLNKLRADIIAEIDSVLEQRNSELKDKIEELKGKIDMIEQRYENMDGLISDRKQKAKKRSWIGSILR